MKKISLWLGVLSVIYAALYLLGLLPVSVWQYILDLFIERETGTYYKIVPTGGAAYQTLFALVVGIALILYAKLPFKRGSIDE